MVSRDHQAHFEEFAHIRWQTALEPKQRHNATDSYVLLQHIADRHTGVKQLLPSLVTDGRHERGRLTDQTKLASPRVIHRHGRGRYFLRRYNKSLLHHALVHGSNHITESIERCRHMSAGFGKSLVFSRCCFAVRVGARSRMPELHLRGEHSRTRSNAPGNQRLGDAAVLQRFAHFVLLHTANLSQQY
uniref:Uncharacterized protein n=1 Tax=Anopheles quadriannulatus TaxID=34691 RepID=A0A182XTQ1_ANOQN